MNRIPSYQEYVNFVQQMGGNQGYMSPYTPAQTAQPTIMQGNVLPPQQVLQANGKASIDALRMSPNSSVLIMDNTAPMVWLCTSDGLGNVTSTGYDIVRHQDAPALDVTSFEARLAAVEGNVSGLLAKWEELTNGSKSNAGRAQSRQNVRPSGEPGAD